MSSTTLHNTGTVDFAGLRVPTAASVITPRLWTRGQSLWAAELLRHRPPGPVVELFAGSGHIGLEAARLTGRPAVLVDSSAEACALALRCAHDNRIHGVEVRCRSVECALRADDRPAIILADPPYLPSGDVAAFPDDPVHAIDGGSDGLDLLKLAVDATASFVAAGVPMLMQFRGVAQASALDRWLREHRRQLSLVVVDLRGFGEHRAVARIDRFVSRCPGRSGHERR